VKAGSCFGPSQPWDRHDRYGRQPPAAAPFAYEPSPFFQPAAHAIWIREDETAFVLGVWLQIQNAPGKHVAGIEMPGVRSDTVGIRRGGFDGNEGVAAAIHLLMLEAEERKARVPRLLAFPL
jgi:hypothetical protein